MSSIFINPVVPDSEKKRIKHSLPAADLHFRQDYTENDIREAFLKCDIVFGNPPLEWVEASDRLVWIQLASAGLDPFEKVIAERKIQFSNLKDFFSRPVAETALAGILSLYRNIHLLLRAQNEKKWAHEPIRKACETVEGKNILILGPGSIGKMIGRLLAPMEGKVSYFGSKSDFVTSVRHLDALLPTTDILIACLPESEATIHLLSEQRLNLLPSKAILINVGRGSLIDEPALVKLLTEQKLRGAFLDVTAEEPLPSGSPLWDVPNLILGQHAGGGMPEELARKIDFFLKNYGRFIDGHPANLLR